MTEIKPDAPAGQHQDRYFGRAQEQGMQQVTNIHLYKVLDFFTKYCVWDSIGAGYGMQMIPLHPNNATWMTDNNVYKLNTQLSWMM